MTSCSQISSDLLTLRVPMLHILYLVVGGRQFCTVTKHLSVLIHLGRLDPLATSRVFGVPVEEIDQCVGHVLTLYDL